MTAPKFRGKNEAGQWVEGQYMHSWSHTVDGYKIDPTTLEIFIAGKWHRDIDGYVRKLESMAEHGATHQDMHQAKPEGFPS